MTKTDRDRNDSMTELTVDECQTIEGGCWVDLLSTLDRTFGEDATPVRPGPIN